MNEKNITSIQWSCPTEGSTLIDKSTNRRSDEQKNSEGSSSFFKEQDNECKEKDFTDNSKLDTNLYLSAN